MGRIKSTMVKRAAEQLMTKENFSASFEENKMKLKKILPSKSIQNKVAGYIARLVKAQGKEKKKKKEVRPMVEREEYN